MLTQKNSLSANKNMIGDACQDLGELPNQRSRKETGAKTVLWTDKTKMVDLAQDTPLQAKSMV